MTRVEGAVLLGSPEPRTPEWFRLRRDGITATDLPAILGKSSYRNARTVWHDKRGDLPDDWEESEPAKWGRLLEGPVADEWALMNGVLIERVGVLANIYNPWMRASCDRLIVGRNAALEVKTRNQFVAGKWRYELPDDVLAQVAWQRLVGRFDYIDVACLIGGQCLTTYRYEEDADLEAFLIQRAWELWERVQTGEPPPVVLDDVMLKLLEALHPDRTGITNIGDRLAVALLMDHSSAQSLAKLAEQAKTAAKARILSVMGEAEELRVEGGEPLFTYRERDKTTLNVGDLQANDVELYLKVLEGGHITTTASRVLRPGKGASNVTA